MAWRGVVHVAQSKRAPLPTECYFMLIIISEADDQILARHITFYSTAPRDIREVRASSGSAHIDSGAAPRW